MLDADRGYESCWEKLISDQGSQSKFGPMTVERNDPMFLLMETAVGGAVSHALRNVANTQSDANLLHDDRDRNAGKSALRNRSGLCRIAPNILQLASQGGRPYLLKHYTRDSSFKGHDGYNHSEHYFHSSFCDLVITACGDSRTGR